MAQTYDIALVEQESGDWDVVQDRRILISDVDHTYAVDYVERRRKPDEKVHEITLDGRSTDITDRLRRNRRHSV